LFVDTYAFDFYFFDDEERTKEDIRHLKVYKGDDGFHYMTVGTMLRKLWKNHYDVYIKCTNNKWAFWGSFILAKVLRGKFIVWHTLWYYPPTFQYRFFSWFLIKVLKEYSDAIVVYGKHGKGFLIEKGIDPDKIFIAWQTVDNAVFSREVRDGEMRSIREKFGVSKDKKIILFVGRLIEAKGVEYLLAALNKLDKKTFAFVAVGTGGRLKKMEEYGVKNGIECHFVGLIPYDELPPFYKMATVLVLPSITTETMREPWGLVVNEGFNQGCPAVVTDAVGAAAGGLVIDKVNGLVVPEKDADALADALGKILNDEMLRESMSRNALAEINKWTYERQAQGFFDALGFAAKGDPHETS
jgi:glycosyltransferase involved in cell wall biosynthesis